MKFRARKRPKFRSPLPPTLIAVWVWYTIRVAQIKLRPTSYEPVQTARVKDTTVAHSSRDFSTFVWVAICSHPNPAPTATYSRGSKASQTMSSADQTVSTGLQCTMQRQLQDKMIGEGTQHLVYFADDIAARNTLMSLDCQRERLYRTDAHNLRVEGFSREQQVLPRTLAGARSARRATSPYR